MTDGSSPHNVWKGVIIKYLNSGRLSVLLAFAIAAVLVAGYVGLGKPSETGPAEGPDTEVIHMEVSYGFDVKDEEKLVGFAENVFTGRVIEQVGSEEMEDPGSGAEDSGIPQTQFAVQPLENIKGDLTGTVTVNQQGGNLKQNGDEKKVLIEGDPLLEPGEEYLFVTRYEDNEGWHTIAAQPFGKVRVEDKGERKEVKEEFQQAKKKQKDPLKNFSK